MFVENIAEGLTNPLDRDAQLASVAVILGAKRVDDRGE
jgi:hypothetical protein